MSRVRVRASSSTPREIQTSVTSALLNAVRAEHNGRIRYWQARWARSDAVWQDGDLVVAALEISV